MMILLFIGVLLLGLVLSDDILPSISQLRWHDYDMGVIIHFGITTFAVDKNAQGFCDFNVGNYLPPPDLYNPEKLDTDQWMAAAKSMGAKYAVFVAQHCDGFSQWPSDAEVDGIKYEYSVKYSKWRNGTGDVVQDFVNSAKKHGIAPGVYYSLNFNYYANAFQGHPRTSKQNPGQLLLTQTQYDSLAVQQMVEIWSRYADMAEIWFDGSYTDTIKPGVEAAIEKYAKNAVVFQGPSQKNGIRWVGNERGEAPYPIWARSDDNKQSGEGRPDGQYWAPAECDTIIRNTDWFWRPNHATVGIKSLATLIDTYHKSTGTSCTLLLNMNPDWTGLIPSTDVVRYKEFGDYVHECYDVPLARTNGTGVEYILDAGEEIEFNRVQIMENIAIGENVRQFTVDKWVNNTWVRLYSKRSVGHKIIERIEMTKSSKLRLQIVQHYGNWPEIRDFSVYKCSPAGGAINNHAPYPPSGFIIKGGKDLHEDDYYKLADELISSKLAKNWFSTIVVEEPCFIGRDSSGLLIEDKSRWFKGMKAFGDYCESHSLTFGVHLGAGDFTRGGCVGSKGHEDSDVQQIAGYGATHIFVDWTESDPSLEQEILQRYVVAVGKYGDRTVLSFDNEGKNNIHERGMRSANTWRTTPTYTQASWSNLIQTLDTQENITNINIYSGPNYYNDLGPLYVDTLTDDELIAQHMLWCILDSPRFLYGSISSISAPVNENYLNTKLRDICNDKLGLQGQQIQKTDLGEMYAKQLSNTDWVILFFNRDSKSQSMTFKYPNVGSMKTLKISNAITGDSIGSYDYEFTTEVKAHSSFMIRCAL